MKENKAKTVFVAMSGGVDSSVAALLLKKKGYDLVGVFMRNWHAELHEGFGECTWERDQEDVRKVCAQLDIPFYTWDFSQEYYEDVVEYFFREYKLGRTPNPDVMCNKYIKFGRFYERAKKLGADYVATGHYARVDHQGVSAKLLAGIDPNKDQTYFLWTIEQEQLRHTLFPIGEFKKPVIRETAEAAGLSTAHKPDSQGICFVGKVDVREFLKTRLPEQKGKIVTIDGQEIGEHNGAHFYTEGQRHGINIGGGTPYYVVSKDTEHNIVTVAPGADHPSLFSESLSADTPHWISGIEPDLPLECQARIRYHQKLEACIVEKESVNTVRVTFQNKQRAVAAGQSIVFYQNDECLGGGIIQSLKKNV